MFSSNHIIQSQLERMRQEFDEEKLSASREVSHLNAIISEKNSIIERLRAEGTFEADKQVFEAGLTLESTAGFDSSMEAELEPSFDPTAILFDSSNKEVNHSIQPNGQESDGLSTERSSHYASFSKKASSLTNDTTAIVASELLVGKAPVTKVEKSTQTEPLELPDASKKTAKGQDAKDDGSGRRRSLLDAVSKADKERLVAVESELKETFKLADFYKKACSEKDAKIDQLYETMKAMSDENSKIINELTIEFEQASAMLRKTRSL